MTFKDLQRTLSEMEELGVDMETTACVALHDRVTKVRKIFTNSQGNLFMDTRP